VIYRCRSTNGNSTTCRWIRDRVRDASGRRGGVRNYKDWVRFGSVVVIRPSRRLIKSHKPSHKGLCKTVHWQNVSHLRVTTSTLYSSPATLRVRWLSIKLRNFTTTPFPLNPSQQRDRVASPGATENVGVENAIRSKMQGWKIREWKNREQIAEVENAGVD